MKIESHRNFSIAELAHDLRTPLTAASAYCELIKRRPEAAVEFSDKIIACLSRADRLVQGLLNTEQADDAQSSRHSESFDMVAHVLAIIEDLKSIHGERFNFKANVDSIFGCASAEGIRRVIENLCQNAIRYGDSAAPISVELSWNELEKVLSLAVHNQGNPIKLEDQSRLFSPFVRVPGETSFEKGWGLGLTIVKSIADSHNAKLFVSSDQLDGTTFTLALPFPPLGH